MSAPIQSVVDSLRKLVEQINPPVVGAPAEAPAPAEGVLTTALGEKTVTVQTTEAKKTAPLVEEAASSISKAAEEAKNVSPAIVAADDVIVIPHTEEEKPEVVVDQEKTDASKAEKEEAADLENAIALSKELDEQVKAKRAADASVEKVVEVPAAELPSSAVVNVDKEETLPLDHSIQDGYIIPAERDPFWLPVEVPPAPRSEVPVAEVAVVVIAPKSVTEKIVDDVLLVAQYLNKKEKKSLVAKRKNWLAGL